jgi:uncharacterized membrane protein
MLAWLGREGGHLARSLAIPASAVPGAGANRTRTLSAVFTSAGWMIQAVALLTIGWTRRTGFMRWLGLGLFGLTVIKFLLLDLQQVDVFWRFLTAILVGVALLAVSYLYQRRSRAAVEPAAPE